METHGKVSSDSCYRNAVGRFSSCKCFLFCFLLLTTLLCVLFINTDLMLDGKIMMLHRVIGHKRNNNVIENDMDVSSKPKYVNIPKSTVTSKPEYINIQRGTGYKKSNNVIENVKDATFKPKYVNIPRGTGYKKSNNVIENVKDATFKPKYVNIPRGTGYKRNNNVIENVMDVTSKPENVNIFRGTGYKTNKHVTANVMDVTSKPKYFNIPKDTGYETNSKAIENVMDDISKPKEIPISPNNRQEFIDYMIKAAKEVKTARLHARGVKTSDALNNVMGYMNALLKFLNVSFTEVTKRKVKTSKHICPERITSVFTGDPLFDIGYIVQNCTYSTPLHNLVTIAIVYINTDLIGLKTILSGIVDYNFKINVIVGLYKNVGDTNIITSSFENVNLQVFESGTLRGQMWNVIINKVSTEYVLIARDITSFNYDARLDRLIREIERLSVKVVGGATRDISNKWRLGCQQRAFRNFTISYIEGYDESIHDCVFCDFVEGPFLMRSSDFKKVKFDTTLPEMGLFEDFFMRVGGEQLLCPDAMFYTNIKERSADANDWKIFGRKRSLYEIKYSTGLTINFGCVVGTYPCNKVAGKMLSPCCMKELATLDNYIMTVCKKHNIICAIHCGNLVGAVKFYNVLPWERDGDVQIYTGNYSAANKLRYQYTNHGYRFKQGEIPSSCPKEKVRGYYDISSQHWRAEWYTYCQMDAKIQIDKGLNNTLIPVAGQYVVGPRNPALAMRNKYPFSFRHSEHYSTLNLNSLSFYTNHRWNKCPSKGHDCLNNYYIDGNIQFFNVIP